MTATQAPPPSTVDEVVRFAERVEASEAIRRLDAALAR
jgi:hypothetical protein